MAIILLDPGCVSATSHNAAVNYAFRDECQRLQAPFRCYYNHGAEQAVNTELGGLPVFHSFIPYGRAADPGVVVPEFQSLSNLFLTDLTSHVAPSIQDGDTLVAHTVTAPHVAALGVWLREIRKSLKVRIVLRFHPGFRANDTQEELLRESYVASLKNFATSALNHDTKVFADSEILSAYYRDLVGIPVETAPIPIDFTQAPHPPAASGTLRFMYLGEAREEKGFGLLFEAVRMVYSRGHDVRFTIHVPHLSEEQAERIPTYDGRLQWITGPLLPKPYYQLLSTASAVLVPYDKREYTYRTSHIFVEALGLGKPVVTMKGTWMASEMTRMAAMPGAIASDFSAPALGQAMCELVENWSATLENAQEIASPWRSHHNIQNFVRTLLA